jgi:hypothetical protein
MDEHKTKNDEAQRSVVAAARMSREFLSADDAARYAHEQVGQRRDREFVAMILIRGKRFVVTEPVEAGSGLQEIQLFPLDERGRPVYPANHQPHSLFYSHNALSTLDAVGVQRLKWSRTEALVSLQMFSIHELFHIVLQGVPAYLSSAEDSLLWCEPDSAHSHPLLQRLGTPSNPGPLAQGLEQGSILPVEFVREVAQAGSLRIVLDNLLWGYRGNVTGQWSPFATLGERPVPQQVAYGAVFSSADEAAQDCFSRMSGQTDQEQTWFGFILKQQGKEEYVATELVAVNGVRDKLFSRHCFPITRDGIMIARESFQRHAYFYSRQRVTHTRPNRDWLARHFIVPRDLFVVVYDSRRPLVLEGHGAIPAYIGTQDGALLKYIMRRGSKLFDDDTPNMGLVDIQSNLVSEALTPTGFVRVVANSGELSVLHTNTCWDRKGPVNTDWLPGRHVERRVLGAVHATADDAALAARAKVPANADRVYGGLVLKRSDGFFIATEPVITLQEDFDVKWIFPDESVAAGLFPAGCSIVARYRSRHAREVPMLLAPSDKQLYLNMLSVDTVYSAFKRNARQQDEYLFGPDGSVIRYRNGTWNRFRADLANALTDFASLPNDLDATWIRKRIHEGALSPVDWVDSLAKSGYLQVVAGSPVWGAPRQLSSFSAVLPAPVARPYTPAGGDPRLSPLFAQESSAARHAHEQAGARAALSFGFILINERQNTSVSTLPIAVQDSALAYDRVFHEGQPLPGFAISGLYLCAAHSKDGVSSGELEHFFSPMDVHLLLARAKTNQGYRPVYFSCADGALLRYEMDYYDPVESKDEFGQLEFRPNPFGSLKQANEDVRNIRLGIFTLREYIQRMAKAGRLEVQVPSAFWGRSYQVRDWQPGQPGMTEQELWAWKPELAMGPLFHHPDDASLYTQQRTGSADVQADFYESAIVAKPDAYAYCGLEPLPYRKEVSNPLERIFRTPSDPTTNRRNKTPRFAPGYQLMASYLFCVSDPAPVVAGEEISYASFISTGIVESHTHDLKAKGFNIQAFYYSTPYGALLKYVPTYSQAEKALLMTKQVDVIDGQRRTLLSTTEFISKLAELGELRVLKASFYWNRTGRLGSNWRVSRQEVPLAPIKFRRDEL